MLKLSDTIIPLQSFHFWEYILGKFTKLTA